MNIIGGICYFLGFAVIKTGSFAAKLMSLIWKSGSTILIGIMAFMQSSAALFANTL